MTPPSTPLTDKQLDQLDKLCKEATPGPWELFPKLCGPDGQMVIGPEGGPICEVGDPYPRSSNKPQENMEVLCASRTAMPALIAEVWQQRFALVTMREALEPFAKLAGATRAGSTPPDKMILYSRGTLDGEVNITAADANTARSALSASTDYANKVVVDRKELKKLWGNARSVQSCWRSAADDIGKLPTCETGRTALRSIRASVHNLNFVVARLNSLRSQQGGGE